MKWLILQMFFLFKVSIINRLWIQNTKKWIQNVTKGTSVLIRRTSPPLQSRRRQPTWPSAAATWFLVFRSFASRDWSLPGKMQGWTTEMDMGLDSLEVGVPLQEEFESLTTSKGQRPLLWPFPLKLSRCQGFVSMARFYSTREQTVSLVQQWPIDIDTFEFVYQIARNYLVERFNWKSSGKSKHFSSRDFIYFVMWHSFGISDINQPWSIMFQKSFSKSNITTMQHRCMMTITGH